MRRSLTAVTLLTCFAVASCSDQLTAPTPDAPVLDVSSPSSATGTFVIMGTGEALPPTLANDVAAAGGTLLAAHAEIGVAYAASTAPGFQSTLAGKGGIESVTPDAIIQWVDPEPARDAEVLEADVEEAVASIGDAESFYALQWWPAAIQAPEAWNAGFLGQGVRVAVLDGGIHSAHVDIAPNLDVAASRSFVPGFAFNEDVGTFWHGTHVAGIVAARDNTIGTLGIAPRATLIGVKVLHNGTGSFAALIDGILYAATAVADGGAGANVINMSLGAVVDEKAKGTKAAVRELKKAVDRATKFAFKNGVTVIAAAGNDALNFDALKHLFQTPAMNQHVISVSATGPHGWALGATDFERPAYYTNFGKALVDLAAPGGTIGLFLIDGVDQLCVVAGILQFCETFDLVLSTSRGAPASVASYTWAQGTSMAAPMVSGVAALIIQKNGGSMHPAQVAARLQQSAIDHGKPGKDAFYGHGFVNAHNAIQ
jgi:subtilisin family serine protease